MSTLKVNNLQVGQDGTATNNYTLYQPASPDGTVRLGYGVAGSVTDILTLKNSRLGIGTDNPQAKLVVSDGSNGLELNPNSSNAVVSYNRSTSAYAPIGLQGSTVQLRIGGVGTALHVHSNGKVGIGNDNPQSKLQIENAGEQLRLTYPSITSYIHEVKSNGDYAIDKDGTERLRIGSNGNVGIGDSDPRTGLTITKAGTAPTTSGNTYPMPAGNWVSTWSTGTANGNDYWAGFGGSGYAVSSATVNIALAPNHNNTSQQAGMYIAGEATSASSSDFTIGKIVSGSATGSSDVAGNQRATKSELMRVDSNGRVGIGTSTFADTATALVIKNGASGSDHTLLDIVCDTNETARVRFSEDGNSFPAEIKYDTFSNFLAFSANSAERLRITSGGDVGIGEDSPADRLVVQKTNASGDVGIRVKNDTLTDGDATNPTTASLYLNTSTGDFNTFYIQARRSDNNTHFGYSNPRDVNHTPNMVITSGGMVRHPKLPCFFVRNSTGANGFSANSKATWDIITLNNGSHFNNSNDRFVCPIDGFYFFSCQMLSSDGVRLFHQLNKNGTRVDGTRSESYGSTSNYQTNTFVAVVQASTNDYFEVEVGTGGGYGNIYANFNGYLIG